MVLWLFWIVFVALFAIIFGVGVFYPDAFYLLYFVIPLFVVGLFDIIQSSSNILRLYPLVGHLRYMLQGIRPQVQQYFIETNQDGEPFSREVRDLVYQRATKTLDTLPFGTQRNVYAPGFDAIYQSIVPKSVSMSEARCLVGGPQCKKPYSASLLNISAMSYGSISKNAVLALNRGARMGNFAHNTGEGGLTEYHLREGGDLIWQIASGYFGCRKKNGRFDPEIFREKSQLENVKMIEIKISQGAKPGHGGILPAKKITPEIAQIRGVELGKDCISPTTHPEFNTPIELLEFVARLRDLSGGKPVGFKLCVGSRREFLGICKAMLKTGIYPDFITVDGAEGGTGAAPVEFTDFVGVPLNEGLVFVRNALVGVGLKEHIRIIAASKIITGFDMVCKIALGADICSSARGMMFALGCIQSRRCNKNTCPTGVTTQKPWRVYSLSVDDKGPRVKNYHEATIKSFLEVMGAAGIEHVADLTPNYIYRRVDIDNVRHYDSIYPFLKPSQLLRDEDLPEFLSKAWREASAETFERI